MSFKQTETKPQETPDFNLAKSRDTFSFEVPLSLKKEK